MRKKTTEDYIRQAREKHGDRYDYSQSEYVGAREKLTIICPEHGAWHPQASSHLVGTGCPSCGGRKQLTTEEFIRRAHEKHGDKFDYSKTVYTNSETKMTIICPKHGEFKQKTSAHLKGTGCPDCGTIQRGLSSPAKGNFRSANDEISFVCPDHGLVRQLPVNHLSGSGCPKCRYAQAGAAMRKSVEDFIKEARNVHGDKYNYSLVEYIGARDPVTIICPVDGEFLQTAGAHLRGTGCPRCSRRGQGAPRNLVRALRGEFDEPKDAFVYVVRFNLPSTNQRLFKIGSGSGTRWRSTTTSIRRVGGTDAETTKIDFKTSGEAIVVEHLAHDQVMETKYVVPPEFKFAGYSEVFTKEPDLAAVEAHPTLTRFRSGDRWDPKDELS
ncbi:hypothetical protein [Magnetovibrio blakemorei]|uniref:Zinc-ribbon domain-containing protein n=1 Tax=Magnetovibrio blakemorei TaxID=28181 RepID=A0A1E5Q6J1_9PROT|nr:hypothetical protein [Magnetovibrio blakemorei]OEJ66279.1 hypothetical protein BEN30_12910 [Magnetovibrio blakemorei]